MSVFTDLWSFVKTTFGKIVAIFTGIAAILLLIVLIKNCNKDDGLFDGGTGATTLIWRKAVVTGTNIGNCQYSFTVTPANIQTTTGEVPTKATDPSCYIWIERVEVQYQYNCEMPVTSEIVHSSGNRKTYGTVFPLTCDGNIIIDDRIIGTHNAELIINNSCRSESFLWPFAPLAYARDNVSFWDCSSSIIKGDLPYSITDEIGGRMEGSLSPLLYVEWRYNISRRIGLCIETTAKGVPRLCRVPDEEDKKEKESEIRYVECNSPSICSVEGLNCNDITQIQLTVYFTYSSDCSADKPPDTGYTITPEVK